MARHLAGPFGNVTGSGERVTVTLDGDVNPSELLLFLIVWAPLALPETYVQPTPVENTFHKSTDPLIRMRNKNLDAMTREELEAYADFLGVYWEESWTDEELKEAIGLYHDFHAVGTVTVSTQVGFSENHAMAGGLFRGWEYPWPGVDGLVPFPAPFTEWQPSGIAARLQGLWYPTAFSEVVVEFSSHVPTELFAIPWCEIRTWKIAQWGGRPTSKAGNYGVGRPEPTEHCADTFDTITGNFSDLHHHTATDGVVYQILGPDDLNINKVSDGGDTHSGWEPTEMVPHLLEYGIAGRWGIGTGTDFDWEAWPDPIKLDTVDHGDEPILYSDVAASYATYADLNSDVPSYAELYPDEVPVRFAIYYKLLDNRDEAVPIEGGGTWGQQSLNQMIPDSNYLTFRGPGLYPYLEVYPPPTEGESIRADTPRTGAMLRGTAIAVADPSGGWLPQIYRRVGPAQ